MRKGRSIQTTATNAATQNWLRPDISAKNVQPWAGADIIVHVRETTWMQSRHLLDDHGNACTLAPLKVWLEEAALERTWAAATSPELDIGSVKKLPSEKMEAMLRETKTQESSRKRRNIKCPEFCPRDVILQNITPLVAK